MGRDVSAAKPVSMNLLLVIIKWRLINEFTIVLGQDESVKVLSLGIKTEETALVNMIYIMHSTVRFGESQSEERED